MKIKRFCKRYFWGFLDRDPMPIRDQITLSPWEKWKRYRRPPVKVLIHILLMFFVIAQCLSYGNQVVRYQQDIDRTVSRHFMPPSSLTRLESGSGSMVYYAYDVENLISSVQYFSNQYFTFQNRSVGLFNYVDNVTKTVVADPPDLSLVVTMFSHASLADIDFNEEFDMRTNVTAYPITPKNPIGPFSGSWESTRDLLNRLKSMTITALIQSVDISGERPKCVIWGVTGKWHSRSSGGVVELTTDLEPRQCGPTMISKTALSGTFLMWSSVFIIIMGIWSSFLTIKAVITATYFFMRTKHTLARGKSTGLEFAWGDLSVWERLSLFNFWHFVILLSNAFQVCSSVYLIMRATNRLEDEYSVSMLLGLSALFSSISILRYFEFAPRFNLLMNSLQAGMPNFIRFLISSIPIFVGYAVLGYLLFGPYSGYFGSFDRSAVSLFSILNGDVIHDTFDRTYSRRPVLGFMSRLYLYTFISLFIYAVLNIFILIMEDSYFKIHGEEWMAARRSLAMKIPAEQPPPPPSGSESDGDDDGDGDASNVGSVRRTSHISHNLGDSDDGDSESDTRTDDGRTSSLRRGSSLRTQLLRRSGSGLFRSSSSSSLTGGSGGGGSGGTLTSLSTGITSSNVPLASTSIPLHGAASANSLMDTAARHAHSHSHPNSGTHPAYHAHAHSHGGGDPTGSSSAFHSMTDNPFSGAAANVNVASSASASSSASLSASSSFIVAPHTSRSVPYHSSQLNSSSTSISGDGGAGESGGDLDPSAKGMGSIVDPRNRSRNNPTGTEGGSGLGFDVFAREHDAIVLGGVGAGGAGGSGGGRRFGRGDPASSSASSAEGMIETAYTDAGVSKSGGVLLRPNSPIGHFPAVPAHIATTSGGAKGLVNSTTFTLSGGARAALLADESLRSSSNSSTVAGIM